jgi:hypothetical protein
MTKIYNLFFIIFIAISLFSCTNNDTSDPNAIKYRVTFTSTWSATTHPTNFPSSPHFSGLVGATHTEAVSLWSVGFKSSPGIESMAETGSKSIFESEISATENVEYYLSGPGVGSSPSSVSFDFSISEEYPYVTLVSMLAPSPDWFVGVSKLPLFIDGAWVRSKTVTLNVYDAGSDNGKIFDSNNLDTSPKEVIRLLSSAASDTDFSSGQPDVGTFYFEKL